MGENRDTHLCGVGECDDGETVIVLHGTEDSAAGMLDYIQNVQTRAALGLAVFAQTRCISTHGARDIDNEAEIQRCASARVLLFGDGFARGSNSNEQAFACVFMKSDPEGHVFTARRGLIGWRSVRIEVLHCRRLSRRTRAITLFMSCSAVSFRAATASITSTGTKETLFGINQGTVREDSKIKSKDAPRIH